MVQTSEELLSPEMTITLDPHLDATTGCLKFLRCCPQRNTGFSFTIFLPVKLELEESESSPYTPIGNWITCNSEIYS
jgi:hypothetical protein